ncbi:hypothetical protein L6164_006187 [Bauhinia variegata]|uniref:Uncharacterized protein n=1 Tax=Bauhinia variegata TaxID=167791 RepID=A0ACB9PTP2_BAUVA|nr:hypothetical protein L6164_006187 [Bauhinia variegata]
MEDEFEEFVMEPFLGKEIDLDYEFDAPRFYDFTQPETFWEALEAEHWFASAASYPPSPFVLKLRWQSADSIEIVDTSATCRDGENLDNMDDYSGCCMETEVSGVDDDSRGPEFYSHTTQDTLQGKIKSPGKLTRFGNSTLMKPTASHLAKQKNPQEAHIHTARNFRRLQNQNSPVIDGLATKRQKLETGYMRKAAHLKHQALFTHKKPKKTDLNLDSRPKVTIPRQPDLETARRAQMHKCMIDAELSGQTNSSSHTFKARPLNRKILEAPSISFRKKKTPQTPEFQVFHLKTSERAMQYASSNARGISNSNSISNDDWGHPIRPNLTEASKQEKCRMANKLRGSSDDKGLSSKWERGVFRNIKEENAFPMELKTTKDKKFPNEPPLESFSKLSLVSEVKQTTKSKSKEQPISKGLKENRPDSFLQKHERTVLVEETKKPCGKQHQCLNERGVADITSHLYAGRCLNIC